MKYFNPLPKTAEELKKTYRKLATIYHSDCGGNDTDMKIINAEYTALFEKLKNIHTNSNGETYQKETNETPQQFINIINELIRFENVLIEIIGSFVWVSGDTKPYKERLKELGFKWHSTKKCWYLVPNGYTKRNRKNYSLDDIRNMYGSQEVENQPCKKIVAAM